MFNYKWYLKDGYPAKGIDKHNKKVFTTFACGGGSSMGYKLAGYDVIAANDIDPQMAVIYKKNHNPKYFFECNIAELLNLELPKELYDIDILDGSPPCSTFSISGSREKNWGKNKKFREGQSEQILDDLFFQFIKLVNKLKPKVVIAENVKGMLAGNARGYILEIKKQLQDIGYNVQIFLFNAATMGVPQKRERVFILCSRKDLNLPTLEIEFKETPIKLKEIIINSGKKLSKIKEELWNKCEKGKAFSTIHKKGSYFNSIRLTENKVLPTITASRGGCMSLPDIPYEISDETLILGSSFPLDYNFLNIDVKYIVGMSVPPVMMAQVSNQIYKQWLSKV